MGAGRHALGDIVRGEANGPGRLGRAGTAIGGGGIELVSYFSAEGAGVAIGCECSPVIIGGDGKLFGEGGHLFVVEELGMVVRIAGDRQAPALDGIGKDDDGPVFGCVGLFEHADHLGEVVAAEVADDGWQVGIADGGDDLLQPGIFVSVDCDEAAAQLVTGKADEKLILLVAHVVDALADLLAIFLGEEVLQLAPVFGFEHLPAPLVEH